MLHSRQALTARLVLAYGPNGRRSRLQLDVRVRFRWLWDARGTSVVCASNYILS